MQSRRKVLSLDLSPSNGVSVSMQSSFRDPVVARVDIVIGVSGSIGFGSTLVSPTYSGWIPVDSSGFYWNIPMCEFFHFYLLYSGYISGHSS